MDHLTQLEQFWWVIPIVVLLASYKLWLRLFGVVIIPDDKIGIINKKFVLFGANRTLPGGKIIALNGEAGIQADTLPPGIHYLFWPWQFDIELAEFTKVKDGQVGVVESRDGNAIGTGRVIAKTVPCDNFQDARAFLTNGGQRGPQMACMTPGSYRINTQLFTVKEHPACEVEDGMVGVVTTKDGATLAEGDIAGKVVEGHHDYQDGEAFIANGGFRGPQEQVLKAGRYYLNPRFAEVHPVKMTEVPIAHVGVVISYVGEKGVDVTGTEFQHGNLVEDGQKGVRIKALDPNKYPVNPDTHKVELVPTANVVLNWSDNKTEAHKLDENLSSITVRTKDGFSLNMDVSVIIHIPATDAAAVIARFGTVANMVSQVLQPTVSNYFRNAAQDSGVIDFIQSRTQRQNEAKIAIQAALAKYNVAAMDTLIGDINPPADLMRTLTDRQIAEQQKKTYVTQTEAAGEQQKLKQAEALANTQAQVVSAERQEAIATFEGKAAVAKARAAADAAIQAARGEAEAAKTRAEAEAQVLTTVGAAKATSTKAVGEAEAEVIRKKTEAMGKGNYALMQVATSLAGSKQELVPRILVAGGDKEGGNTGLLNVLTAKLLAGDLLGGSGGMAQASSTDAAETPNVDAAAATPAASVPVTASSSTNNGHGTAKPAAHAEGERMVPRGNRSDGASDDASTQT